MILLAKNVTGPVQRSLGLIDIDIERNSYGRQIDSFEGESDWLAPDLEHLSAGEPDGGAAATAARRSNGRNHSLPLVFIRAPRLTRLGVGVEPLARCRGDVVLARQGRVTVASFHPELARDDRVHRSFLSSICRPSDQVRIST